MAALAGGILLAAAVQAPGAMAGGLFAEMAGSWRGEGSVVWSTGETEQIRCQATYEVENDGNKIIQDMTCATPSTRLIVKSSISYNPAAGAITGTWSETSYGIKGWVSGNASSGSIKALVQSSKKDFAARVSVLTRGEEQTVTIEPQDLELTEVSVTLRKVS